MSRKAGKFKQTIWLESRRGRMTERPETPPSPHEPIPRRSSERPPHTTIPQPHVPHPVSDPAPPHIAPEKGPGPVMMTQREPWGEDDLNAILPPYARRKFRGWVVTRFDVRRVQRLIPLKSTNFRLRYRNLSYKRKWNLGWC